VTEEMFEDTIGNFMNYVEQEIADSYIITLHDMILN
jgi:hypothetical protein